MNSHSTINYYADKSRELPRFLYRNFHDRLELHDKSRESTIAELQATLRSLQLKGDWLKLKWCLPHKVREILTESERAFLEKDFEARREKRNMKFLEVFPHCSDEFSVTLDFLVSSFGDSRTPLISPKSRVITIGSCFARNIAVFLKSKGFEVRAFQQAEDLNSPFSNSKMLAIAAASVSIRDSYVSRWMSTLYPRATPSELSEITQRETARLASLSQFIRESDVIVVTCGNVFDYFLSDPDDIDLHEPGPKVAPKFFSIASNEDLDLRRILTKRLLEAGAIFRMGTFGETSEALVSQYNSIRAINPSANVIFTLSPVPIDSAIGVSNPLNCGAVELDCSSKSVLRAALSQFMSMPRADKALFYFPSFEIVRWVAPNIGVPVFGKEDASSRHVSNDILEGVYAFFLYKFGDPQFTPHS